MSQLRKIHIFSFQPMFLWSFISYDVGDSFVVEDFELQRQVVYTLNSVLYEQLQYKGNEFDYYNPLNSYIHQVDLLWHYCVFFVMSFSIIS